MCKAASQSQNSKASLLCSTQMSLKKYNIHTILKVATAIALYSASAKDLDTIDCCFLFP